jgi:hypothetical protein
MTASARSRLGLIDERFRAPTLAKARGGLRAADADLAAIQAALRAHRADAGALMSSWLARSHGLEAELATKAPESLFNPARLAAAAKRRLPG